MERFEVHPIGYIHVGEEGFFIQVLPEYIPALEGLEDFGHIQVVWWFDGCDNAKCRAKRIERKPYTRGPEVLGTFATRSPQRPNPIALSCAQVLSVDREAGQIFIAYADANDGSPVLDIKPYTPSLDRVERPAVPDWCAHWPNCTEDSGDFDWGAEFNF